ncbi:MAG: MerR family transcriptional regulator [Chloroflexi bacterium]|nr:MerR family transcriptional regulator [Chloroflexota bacterium]
MAELFRAGEVAGRLGIPPSTLRLYSVRFAAWLSEGAASPGAGGGRRGHRTYDEDDVSVLARVKDLLSRGRTVAEVQAALDAPTRAAGGTAPRQRVPVGGTAPRDVPRQPGGVAPAEPAAERRAAQLVARLGEAVHAVAAPAEAAERAWRPPAGAGTAGSEETYGAAGAPLGEPQLGAAQSTAAGGAAMVSPSTNTEQVLALALRALADAQQSEAVWRRLLERRRHEADWLRAELLRQEVELARLALRLGERMRVILRRVEQIAEPVRALLEERAVEAHGTRGRRR